MTQLEVQFYDKKTTNDLGYMKPPIESRVFGCITRESEEVYQTRKLDKTGSEKEISYLKRWKLASETACR